MSAKIPLWLTIFCCLLMAVQVPLGSASGGAWGTWSADFSCDGFERSLCTPTKLARRFTADKFGCRPTMRLASYRDRSNQSRFLEDPQAINLENGYAAVRFPLGLAPSWLMSGAWTSNGALLLVDALSESTFRIDVNGEVSRLSLGPISGLQATDSGFIAKGLGKEFLRLDREGRYLGEIRPSVVSGNSGLRLFSWSSSKDRIIGFADAKSTSGWQSGWFWLSLDYPQDYKLVRLAPQSGTDVKLYTLGYPFLATLGQRGYFLVFEDGRVRLFSASQVLGSGPGLVELPLRRLFSSPRMPDGFDVRAALSRYRVLEQSTGIAGIYGQGTGLNLLYRIPLGDATEWRLIRLDPDNGKELGEVILPTTAEHLLVVPGEKYWAFVEKGRILEPGEQAAKSLLLIPTSFIRGEPAKQSLLSAPSAELSAPRKIWAIGE